LYAKSLSKKHRGNIWIESEEGKSSECYVNFEMTLLVSISHHPRSVIASFHPIYWVETRNDALIKVTVFVEVICLKALIIGYRQW